MPDLSRLFEPILDAIADPILIVTAEGRVRHANASARNRFDESGNLDIRSLDGTPVNGPEWWRSSRDVTIGAERERFRLQSNQIDDEPRFLIALSPLRYSENEARLRAATDVAGLGLYEWNPRTGALYWDERVREMWGVGADATITDGLFMRAVHPDDRAYVQARIDACVDAQGPGLYEAEYRIVGIDTGVERWVATRGQTFFEGGVAVRFVGVARDITAQKRTEQALELRVAERTADLRKSNETIRALIDASAVAIVTVDRTDRIQTWNAAAEAMFGWSADEVRGRAMPNIPAEQAATLAVAVAQVFEGAAPVPFDMLQRRRDQKELDVNLSLAPLRDADGKIRSYIAVMQNVTDRKHLERERESLMRRIVDTQEEERRRIARELHDEMGQHLTSLKMGIESLSEESVTPVIAHLASVIARTARSIDRLCLELRPGTLDDVGLEAAVGSLVSQFTRESGIAVDVHAESLTRLPDAIETLFYRVLQEGLTNVWKHSGATMVSVIFDRHADSVRMIIEDNGRGFVLDTLPANHSRNRFGLLGMRERASLAGGTLHIESSPGSGTSLFVRVPLP